MEINKPLVSVITPVYNASEFLHRCMDSVLRQTYSNVEIVTVDDCSTDDSFEILTEYATHDSRVHVLRNVCNMGAPGSRQKAMKEIRGGYVAELDSDDWLEKDAIEKAMRCLTADQETDIAVLSLVVHDNVCAKRQRINGNVPLVMTGSEACYWSMDWSISGVFVAKRKIFDETPYDINCGVYGDENTTHLQYLHAKKVRLTDGLYNFTLNDTSVTHAVNIRRFDILKGRMSFREQLIKENADDRLLKKQAVTMWKDYIAACHLYYAYGKEFSVDDRQRIYRQLREMYCVFDMKMLPVSVALKPGYMLLPTFGMFYAQLGVTFRLKATSKNKHKGH